MSSKMLWQLVASYPTGNSTDLFTVYLRFRLRCCTQMGATWLKYVIHSSNPSALKAFYFIYFFFFVKQYHFGNRTKTFVANVV